MCKCKGCKREYEDEECLMATSGDSIEEYRVFDGETMRDTCPACGGIVYPVEEALLAGSAA